MRKINLTPALTSLATAEKLHAIAKNNEQGLREGKAEVIAAYAIDACAGRVRPVSKEDYRVAPRFDDVEATLRNLRDTEACKDVVRRARAKLAAACLIGYTMGAAADELKATSAHRLNIEDYQSMVGECFFLANPPVKESRANDKNGEPEGFDFELWCSQHPIASDVQDTDSS